MISGMKPRISWGPPPADNGGVWPLWESVAARWTGPGCVGVAEMPFESVTSELGVVVSVCSAASCLGS